jgi:hypothetical protein
MKKIYNYLFPVFLSLFALAACDEDNEEIVPMSYTDPVATVTKIDPVEGYVGNEFTVSGSDFGIITEDVKVFIGSQESVVVSCAEMHPCESAGIGNNRKITDEVFGQRVELTVYRVLGSRVSGIETSYGFPGAVSFWKDKNFFFLKPVNFDFRDFLDKQRLWVHTKTILRQSSRDMLSVEFMTLIMARTNIDWLIILSLC